MARGGAAGSDGTRRRPEREEMARPGTRVRVPRVELRAEQGEREPVAADGVFMPRGGPASRSRTAARRHGAHGASGATAAHSEEDPFAETPLSPVSVIPIRSSSCFYLIEASTHPQKW